ncbi:MAG: hypothetical protein AN485_09345, partial [Anabaena sp. MDT14b]
NNPPSIFNDIFIISIAPRYILSSLQGIIESCKSSHNQKVESEKLRCGHIFNKPHPNPPLGKGRELNFPVSPLSKGD